MGGKMDTDWYVTMVRDATTIATFFFDLTGGKWSLAQFCEALEDLLDASNISGVTTIIQKLYEATDQEFTWANQINTAKGALFVDALVDALSADMDIISSN